MFDAPVPHLIAIALLAIALSWMAVSRWLATSALSDDLVQQRKHAEAALEAQAGDLLRLSAQPLAWAVRPELQSGELRDVDAYMGKLVKERDVKRVLVVGGDGKVVASTNLKFKGQQVATLFPDLVVASTEPTVTRAGEDLRIVVPVMDYDRQLGVVVLDYARDAFLARLSPAE